MDSAPEDAGWKWLYVQVPGSNENKTAIHCAQPHLPKIRHARHSFRRQRDRILTFRIRPQVRIFPESHLVSMPNDIQIGLLDLDGRVSESHQPAVEILVVRPPFVVFRLVIASRLQERLYSDHYSARDAPGTAFGVSEGVYVAPQKS